jgi:hypothetical protein
MVYLWPNHAAKKWLPPLVLRLVVVNDGREPIYLLTNVFAGKRLSDADAAAIYRRRWGIEVCQPEYASSVRLYQLAA